MPNRSANDDGAEEVNVEEEEVVVEGGAYTRATAARRPAPLDPLLLVTRARAGPGTRPAGKEGAAAEADRLGAAPQGGRGLWGVSREGATGRFLMRLNKSVSRGGGLLALSCSHSKAWRTAEERPATAGRTSPALPDAPAKQNRVTL